MGAYGKLTTETKQSLLFHTDILPLSHTHTHTDELSASLFFRSFVFVSPRRTVYNTILES